MITSTSRLQPSDVGVGARSASTPIAARSGRVLAAAALLCLALFALLNQSLGSGSRPVASVVRSRVESRDGLLSLPAGARGPVSAALGRDQAVYRLDGLVARNPAQGLVARFGRSGVAITAGSASFDIGLRAFGRGSALRALPAVAPVASASGVSYARGSVREWWANGPLGLEQGFDVARRPVGSGALTLSLAVPAGARLDHGAVLLPGGLRYTGVHATGAGGRVLRSWLEVRGGLLLVRVDDRGAQYPVRVDPFVQQAELTASDSASYDELGYSVAVSGSTAVVGAPSRAVGGNKQQGAVYVFEMKAGGWASATQTAELTDSAGSAGVELGYSVAVSGDTIAAGEPAGSEILHDSHPENTQGTVDVFTTTGAWTSTSTPSARLTVSESQSSLGGELGWSVAVSGSTIVAGAPFDGTRGDPEGEAFVFTEPVGGWSGAHTQAAVLKEKEPSGADHFGTSVAVSEKTVVVGALYFAVGGHEQGAADVFTEPGGGWSGAPAQTARLLASDPSGSDELGCSVGVSHDTVVAGALNHKVGAHEGQGAAYVFVMPAGGWVSATQNAELTASDGGEGDELGYSVAVSGNTVVAGARQHQVGNQADQGAAYVFTEPGGGWSGAQTQAQELTAAGGAGSDNFGDSIAVSGETILVGVPRQEASGANPEKGAAYIFEGLIPTIKKLSPKKGTTAGGTRVTIKGTNFTGVTAVKFGSTDATIDSSSGTSITVTTPAEAAGTVAVSVTTDSGTSSPSSKAKFKFKGPKK